MLLLEGGATDEHAARSCMAFWQQERKLGVALFVREFKTPPSSCCRGSAQGCVLSIFYQNKFKDLIILLYELGFGDGGL